VASRDVGGAPSRPRSERGSDGEPSEVRGEVTARPSRPRANS
jgi:hypothetical protein